jgi:membrane protein DedA with SNARE-associated domain
VSGVLAHTAFHVAHHFRGPRVDFVGVGLAAAVTWIGVTGPGEVALIGAGIAASRGRPDIGSVITVAWLGGTLGGTGGWLIGRFGGRRVVLAGSWLRGWRERALESGNRFFERYGVLAVWFAPSWVAGLNRMQPARFLLFNAACALVWALLFGLGSYLLGPSIRDVAADAGLVGSLVFAALVLAAVLGARRGIKRARGREGGPREPSDAADVR